MPKSSSKEIVEDSEEEQVKTSRKSKNKTRGSRADTEEEEKRKDDNNSDEDEVMNEKETEEDKNGEDEGENGEEYEIESIIKAQAAVFEGGKLGYLVRWKGYGEEHDSWVTESDAENAGELIDQYWRKQKKTPREFLQSAKARGRPRKSDEKVSSGQKRKKSDGTVRKKAAAKGSDDDDEGAEKAEDDEIEEIEEIDKPSKPAKRAKTSRTTSAKKARAENGASELSKQTSPEAEDSRPASDYRPADEELAFKKSWEKIVKTIDTIENFDGDLKVFFTMNNGDKVFASSPDCRERFPQKVRVSSLPSN